MHKIVRLFRRRHEKGHRQETLENIARETARQGQFMQDIPALMKASEGKIGLRSNYSSLLTDSCSMKTIQVLPK
jgi:hypothetical protein